MLKSVWDASDVSATDRLSFETALIELAGNIIRHRDQGVSISYTLTIEASDDRLAAILSDSGAAVDIDLSPRAMPDQLAEAGRGLPLVQALVDEFEYSRTAGQNHWRISRMLTRDQ
jgi:serine/threonine-protein kinase RsbW